MTGKLKNCKNIDFQTYVDAVKTESITWEFFVQLMEDLCITKKRQKMFISILLQEFKNYIDKEKESMLHEEDENYDKSMIQESMIQNEEEKSNFMMQEDTAGQKI